MVIPFTINAAWSLQAELSLPSASELSEADATVISKETIKIWGVITRAQLHLKVAGVEQPAVTVLETISADSIPQPLRVVFSENRPERVFVVGDYPYWPYSVAFLAPLALYFAIRHYERKHQQLAANMGQ